MGAFADLQEELTAMFMVSGDIQRAFLGRSSNLVLHYRSVSDYILEHRTKLPHMEQDLPNRSDIASTVTKALLAAAHGVRLSEAKIENQSHIRHYGTILDDAEKIIRKAYGDLGLVHERERFDGDATRSRELDETAIKRFHIVQGRRGDEISQRLEKKPTEMAEVQIKLWQEPRFGSAWDWKPIFHKTVSLEITFDTLLWALHQLQNRISVEKHPQIFSKEDPGVQDGIPAVRFRGLKKHESTLRLTEARTSVTKLTALGSKKATFTISVIELYIVFEIADSHQREAEITGQEGRQTSIFVIWATIGSDQSQTGDTFDEHQLLIGPKLSHEPIVFRKKFIDRGGGDLVTICYNRKDPSAVHRVRGLVTWGDIEPLLLGDAQETLVVFQCFVRQVPPVFKHTINPSATPAPKKRNIIRRAIDRTKGAWHEIVH